MPLTIKSLLAFLLTFNLTAHAQKDSAQHSPVWYVPTGITLEYAGGFGLASAGAVFTPLKKTEIAITLGYIPPKYGKIWSVNTLISYKLFNLKINERLTLQPLNAGGYVNLNFGDKLYLKWPSNYPPDYYWWNSALRVGPFLEAELKYALPKQNRELALFFQCLTNDLYIATYVVNTQFVTIRDILVLGAGMKFLF